MGGFLFLFFLFFFRLRFTFSVVFYTISFFFFFFEREWARFLHLLHSLSFRSPGVSTIDVASFMQVSLLCISYVENWGRNGYHRLDVSALGSEFSQKLDVVSRDRVFSFFDSLPFFLSIIG